MYIPHYIKYTLIVPLVNSSTLLSSDSQYVSQCSLKLWIPVCGVGCLRCAVHEKTWK